MGRLNIDIGSDVLIYTETGEELDDLKTDNQVAPSKKLRWQLPIELPQSTFSEARNASIAIADGTTLRRWREIKGEVALTHLLDDEALQAKFAAPEYLAISGHVATYDSLRDELRTLSPQGVLLFQISIGLALQERHATLQIDELIRL